MTPKYHPCPGSAPGPFYIEAGGCHPFHCRVQMARICDIVEKRDVPGLHGWHCCITRQPANDAELRDVINAVMSCTECAVRYAGSDKTILDRIGRPECCDVMPESTGEDD